MGILVNFLLALLEFAQFILIHSLIDSFLKPNEGLAREILPQDLFGKSQRFREQQFFRGETHLWVYFLHVLVVIFELEIDMPHYILKERWLFSKVLICY